MRDMIDEQWRPIEGYEGLYEVSNLGKVKSLDRIDCRGHLIKGMILKLEMSNKGYLRVDLSKEGKEKHFKVHRIVAQAFIPNPEGLPQINHRDEDKTNNRVDNLEWCTALYNNNYGTRNERGTKNRVQSGIDNGTYDPEMCGILKKDKKKYYRLYKRKYRLKKKQEKKKDNRPSEISLW